MPQTSSFTVFTVCNIAYLPKVLVLADSLRRFHDIKLNVVLFDEPQAFRCSSEHIDITWVKDLGVPKWRELAFMYDITEFSTSLKPFIALKLLENFDKVVFLDPDTCLFSDLTRILEELDAAPVLLTPHYLKPQPDTSHESDLSMMRFGSFNMGFFALTRSPQAREFLTWWSRRCLDFSFMESQFGLSTDQKWVSIAPCFFDFLKMSSNPGYNVAPWNTFEREIRDCGEGRYLVNEKYPLVFFHFSNFCHDDPQYLESRTSSEAGRHYAGLLALGMRYSQALMDKEQQVDRVPYSYDYMSNGWYISPTLRRAYAAVREELPPGHDPFDAAGIVGRFARRNHLFLRGAQENYRYPQFKHVKDHAGKLTVLAFLLRQLLWMLGPNRFYDLSKLFVYLSIYRKNRSLWKL